MKKFPRIRLSQCWLSPPRKFYIIELTQKPHNQYFSRIAINTLNYIQHGRLIDEEISQYICTSYIKYTIISWIN